MSNDSDTDSQSQMCANFRTKDNAQSNNHEIHLSVVHVRPGSIYNFLEEKNRNIFTSNDDDGDEVNDGDSNNRIELVKAKSSNM